MNKFGYLEEGIQKYLERIDREVGVLPVPTSVEERRWYTERRHSVWREPAPDDIAVLDWWICLPGREIPIRMYRRKDSTCPPIVLYFHGGGFVASSYVTHDAITWGLAQQTGALVVSVNYRRAPENPYPAAPQDCYAALEWVLQYASLLKADGERLAVAGDSAGGCLATVVAALAAERQPGTVRMQALLYPCLDTRFDRKSMQGSRDPMLSAATMEYFWSAYLGGQLNTEDALAVPLRRASLAGLPPSYLAVGEFDPLRDETEEYAERLRADGVSIEFRLVRGCIHGFYRARFASAVARAEFEHLCKALSCALKA